MGVTLVGIVKIPAVEQIVFEQPSFLSVVLASLSMFLDKIFWNFC